MLNEITEQIETIKRDFSWEEERFPFSRQDLDLSNDEAWECYYDTVEKFDEELGGVPFTVLKQILMMTWAGYGEQAFIDLLNEPISSPRHIITFFEKEFRANELRSPNSPFFSRKNEWPFVKAKRPCAFLPKDDFHFLIELVELERWAKRNPDILPERLTIYESEEDLLRAEYEPTLAMLETENEKLKARIVELEKASQDGAESEEIASLPTNIKTVLRMLQEQKSDREIAQALYNGGGNSGMSQAQVKALLWRGDEFPAEQSIKNAMKELFLPAGKSTL